MKFSRSNVLEARNACSSGPVFRTLKVGKVLVSLGSRDCPNVFRRTNFDFAELVADLALLIGDLCVAFAVSSFDERQKINSRQNVEGGLVSDIANGDSKRNLSSSVERIGKRAVCFDLDRNPRPVSSLLAVSVSRSMQY